MRHVSRTHRVALDWLFDRINLDPKIQIKHIDTKNQLADILTKGNFTRDEWNHLLCLFNTSHFSSTNCLEVMSKRTQENVGEDRFTAKSKPMTNLVSRCHVRDPNVLASTAPESLGKNKVWKPECTSELVECAANKHGETRIAGLLIKLLRMECWRKVVFSRVEIWWSAGSKNGETCKWTTSRFVHSAHRQICHWWGWYGL